MKLLPTILSAAALAFPASAFLLPPTDAAGVSDKFWKPEVKGIDPAAQSLLKLDCPGCPFAVGEKDGQYTWAKDVVDSSLLLNFTLADDKILLNDRVFFPMEFPHLHAFFAPQIRKSNSKDLPEHSVPVRMGYALEAIPHETHEGHDWFILQFTVFDLAGRQVHIDTVKLMYTINNDGNIPLVMIDTIPVDAPGSPSAIGMDCKNSLCRMKAMIIEKIKQAIRKAKEAAAAAKNSKPAAWVKGCHNKFRGGRPNHHGRPDHGKPRPHHRPHHGGRPHRHHEHKNLRDRIRRFARAVIVPVLLGICAGITAGAIGMIVGHALAYLWIKYARGGRRGPYSRVAQQEEAVIPEEKEGLMTEFPPNYDELEADVKVVEDKN